MNRKAEFNRPTSRRKTNRHKCRSANNLSLLPNTAKLSRVGINDFCDSKVGI
jgi:hypothetical protein